MRLNLFKRSSSLLLLSCLSVSMLVGCGGSGGGTVVAPSTFEGGSVSDGDFEDGTAVWIGNAFNVIDENGNKVNSANPTVAGASFDVNLSQVLPITQGKRYTLKFMARTDEDSSLTVANSNSSIAARTATTRTIVVGIGLNEDPWTNTTQVITITSEWAEYILTLDASNFGSEVARILFDMGADTGLVLLDDVSLNEVGDIPPVVEEFDGGLLSNGAFESGAEGWIGNAANVTDELLGFDGTKANFADVATAGNAFDVNLSQVVAITEGTSYTLTFKAKSNRNRTILAGIGLNQDPWTNLAESVSLTTEWETFTLTQTANFGNANSRVLFDMGADTGQVIIDEVALVETDGGTEPPASTELLTNGSFESGVEGWAGNAANVTDELLGVDGTKANFADIAAAGNPWDVNLHQVVAITEGTSYTMTFKAKSNGNRTLVAGFGLNQDPWTSINETVNLTTEWQTFTVAGAANFGNANSRVFFDMGAATGQVIIDDVSLVADDGTTEPEPEPSTELLTNGSFEDGAGSWAGNAANVTDELLGVDGTKANFADIAAAGNPWDVNLHQVVAITEGTSYTMTFKAKSNGNRTLVAGFGLNQDPWTSINETVNLTAEWQTFTVAGAANFGNANSRVFFDMGAATGQVIIDDVSLVEATGTTDPVDPVVGNTISNGDFETASTIGWEELPGDATIAISSTNNGGSSSVQMTVGQIQDALLKQTISAGTLAAGDTVTVSFDLYGSTGVGGVVFVELFSEGASGVSKQEILGGGPLFPAASWATHSFTTTLGTDVSNGVTIQLKASCGAVAECTVDAFFDNVSLVHVPQT